MEGSKTTKNTQKGNHVGGDMAARDINKTYNFGDASSKAKSQLDILYEELKREKDASTIFTEIFDELERFKQYSGEKVIGIENKLENGGRLAYLAFAIKSKEKFAKKLLQNEYSETAQKIYALLLSKVYTSFSISVEPELKKGHPDEYINGLISTYIISPIEGILGKNLLNIYEEEIHGMLYFLTGNCHIKWN